MKIEAITPEAECSERDELLELEISVARRADALWKDTGHCRGKDLVLWLQAEAEVFERRRVRARATLAGR
jgi:hypothetical protein